jgi:hypothetical protein
MPTTFTTLTIDVNSPDGKVTIPNPLYNYTFHPLPLGTDFPTNQAVSGSFAQILFKGFTNWRTQFFL